MNEATLLVLLAGIATFALFSRLFERGSITAPLFFTIMGVICSSIGFGIVEINLDNNVIHILAEVTLILVLFTDAARINVSHLRSSHDLPVRMLVIGMPLTIILGTLIGLWVFPQLLFIEALILAIILAPTDAALGQVVVSSSKVPERIRQALNVESGLNDGIAYPALLFVLSFAAGHQAHGTNWLEFIVLQLMLGPLVGIVLGWSGAKAITFMMSRQWHGLEFCKIFLLSLAFIIYLVATEVGGNGFIAAFVGGMVVGNTLQRVNNRIYEFSEIEGQLLNLIIFFLFGAMMIPTVWMSMEWHYLAYGALSLTLIRMLPVALALIDKPLCWQTQLFLGWFGPRGLASILFVLLVVDHTALAGGSVIFNTVIVTVLLSIILHGLSAVPSVQWYAGVVKPSSPDS